MSTTWVEPIEPQTVPTSRPRPARECDRLLAALLACRTLGEKFTNTSGSAVIHWKGYSSATSTHDTEPLLSPRLQLFERYLPQLESVKGSSRLLANPATELVFPCPAAAGTLAPPVFFQVLDYLNKQPKCPLLALVFAAMVQPLKVVEQVICQGDTLRSELTVWAIVNQATEAQRYAIYDKQWDVMQIFRGSAVEFNLVDREDSPLEDLMQWSDRAFVIEV